MNKISSFALLAIALIIIALPMAALADGSKLAPGDIIEVVVDGEKEFSKPYQIASDGTIIMPMNVGKVQVGGLDTSRASQVITSALTAVLVSPQALTTYVGRVQMEVFVVGQVKNKGLTKIGQGDTVVQAISQAGYDESADLTNINIRRANEVIQLDVSKYLSGEDLTQNPQLLSGDTIVVGAADMMGKITLSGQFNKTGPVPMKKGMTFREAVGLVGGVTPLADIDNISIKRENNPEAMKVDYAKAMSGTDSVADIALKPGDVIFAPELENAFVTVWGGVTKPGQYPVKGRMKLSEVIALAGGPIPDYGDIRKIQLTRPAINGQKAETSNVNLREMMEKGMIEPDINRGDVIYVAINKPKPGFFQILQSILPFGWIFR